uniref:HDC14887 n=1 Tax=Drosophila melanogaster TaxID=7227 RepID=Q6IJH7_DROME|nr:TPA_inf: HDC14887 [Drosophila melanogaster]
MHISGQRSSDLITGSHNTPIYSRKVRIRKLQHRHCDLVENCYWNGAPTTGTLETQLGDGSWELGAGAAALSGCRRQLKDAAANKSRLHVPPNLPPFLPPILLSLSICTHVTSNTVNTEKDYIIV